MPTYMYKTYIARAPCRLFDYSDESPNLDWLLRFSSWRWIILQSFGEHIIIDGSMILHRRWCQRNVVVQFSREVINGWQHFFLSQTRRSCIYHHTKKKGYCLCSIQDLAHRYSSTTIAIAVTLQLQMLIFTTCANRERILCKQVLGASVQASILNF